MIDYQGKKFHSFLKNEIEKAKKGTQSKVSSMNDAIEMMGVSSGTMYQYFKAENISAKTVKKILNIFSATEDEVFGDGHKHPSVQSSEDQYQSSPTLDTNNSNAKYIGDLNDQYDSDGNTKFVEISPGRYRMKVDLVPNFAKAGYLAGFADPSHIEEYPKHEVTVTKHHVGRYKAFDVEGDSMTDGSIESVPDGCIITGREIKRELWESKFHVHKFPNWIFVHKTEGILVKRIKSQNLSTGDLVLEGINPDKDKFPDISINLDDVYKVFNVVKRELD